MTATRRVVLDASAVLAWIFRERGASTVATLLPVSVLPAPTLVEVLYRAPERGHRMTPTELEERLLGMGIEIAAFQAGDASRAAGLISESRAAGTASLSLGDGLCLAVAERLGLPVTGGDQLWATLDLAVSFLPFRR